MAGRKRTAGSRDGGASPSQGASQDSLPAISEGQGPSLPPISENGPGNGQPEISQNGSASVGGGRRMPSTPAHSGSAPSGTMGAFTPGRLNIRPGRADVGPRPARPNVHMTPGSAIPEIDENNISGDREAPVDNTVIWGTSINAEDLRNRINRFLRQYRDVNDNSAEDAKYFTLVKQANNDKETVVNIDTEDIRSTDKRLYNWLVDYPREVIPIFDESIREIQYEACDIGPNDDVVDIICRPYNLEEKKTIRDLDPIDVDKLICIQGMVTRASPIIPDIRTGYFRCERCGAVKEVPNVGGKIDEPEKCDGCGSKFTSTLIHNLCSFTDKQLVKMQERPDDIPEGETPHAVALYVFESNVDVCRPGDRVTITGTYRAVPARVNPRQRLLQAQFRTYIDVNHIQRDESSRLFSLSKDAAKDAASQPQAGASQSHGASESALPMGSQTGPTDMDEDATPATLAEDQFVPLGNLSFEAIQAREKQIKELAADPRLYERMVASVAPNIWQMEDVKKGLLCQLFGGLTKTFPGGRLRGEVNVLMVGDPSVSKSQLLSYVHALAPRGIYTSGKGSSAVGLTAYVTKDPDTREMVLESGALVLSDKGICCIDEFDKMSDSARSMLHEAMEQQTVSVAKAGLISTLNARTSVCACANPIGSRYNPSLSISENINLPPTLLTRFDLIYLVLDKFDEKLDMELARHLVKLNWAEQPVDGDIFAEVQNIPKELLRDYIAYARARVRPTLSEDATKALVSAYRNLRQDGRERKVVVATPRQLESLIRISESLARLFLRDTVGVWEVEEATRLWYTAMSGSAATSEGVIDLDNIITGATAEARNHQQQQQQLLASHLSSVLKGNMLLNELLDEMNTYLHAKGILSSKITKEQLVLALKQMDNQVLFDERLNVVKPIKQAQA